MKTLVERLQGIYKRITGEEDPHIKYRIDSPDNIDAIVNDIENADIGKTTFRNFTYTTSGEAEEIFARIPTYTNSGLETINATMLSADTWNLPNSIDAQDHIDCKLPVIDGKCEFTFIAIATTVALDDGSHAEASSGCTLTTLGSYGETEYSVYKVSIDEDNANLVIYFEV